MPPEVRYCTTSDGVRIAYTVTGEGAPHVFMPEAIVSHVELEWAAPSPTVPLLGELARHNTLIRFDQRGSGLSDRVNPGSIEDLVCDLEAVLGRVGVEECLLTALQTASMAAMTFAARHPEVVRRLVLIDGFVRMSQILDSPQVQAIRAAAASNFELATEVIGPAAFGPGREESRLYGQYIRACVGPEYFSDWGSDWDATSAAAQVAAPALILRHRGLQYVTEEMTRELAARIVDSRVAMVDGLWADDPIGLAVRVAEFVNEGKPLMRGGGTRDVSGVRTVLFTDLVGHTEMMQRLGDVRGRDVLREHERVTRETLKQHGGAEVKSMGDGFMASFASVTSAMECAVALQRAFAAWNDEDGGAEAPRLLVRVGLNAGEPIEEDGDLFGATVILASRVAAQAGAGEILIPEPVRHLLAGKGFVFADRGEFLPKGFDDAVRLFEVRWRD